MQSDLFSDSDPEPWSPAESFSDRDWRNFQEQLQAEEQAKDELLELQLAAYERRVKADNRQAERNRFRSQRRLKDTKFGRCLSCRHALKPKVWASGKKAGWPSLVCSRWWLRDGQGHRGCWYSKPASPQELQMFPTFTLNLYHSLRMRLARGGADRPQ